MSLKFEKLKTLLMELFQLNEPELDFGIYRILHAKSGEVTKFLGTELLPQVRTAFAQYQPADKAALKKQLDDSIAQAKTLGADPEQLPKVRELRAKLADGIDLDALEGEVFDHLHDFFRRYYHEGDFLSRRVYKPGVYAVPYEGQEVYLHWANKDQYYIKSSEQLRDYAFRLRPHDARNPMRVHFRIVDATEGEHGNVKAAEGKDRVFVLPAEGFAAIEDGELALRFEYRPARADDWPEDVRAGKTKPPSQKDLLALAVARVLETSERDLAPWTLELKKPAPTESQPHRTTLAKHLDKYAKAHKFDYFIHKDLGGFLRRELDFYIKNEVMHLDDIEGETAPKVEQYLSKIRVLRTIAGKLIDFLAQLEDFQKKLWLKKKFVVESSWLISVGVIPEEFYPEIAANEAQREEWVVLCAIDETRSDLAMPAYSAPLKAEFLKANPSLVVDTRHLHAALADRILGALGDIESQVGGMLAHGENVQFLALSGQRNSGLAKCVYVDPPYNTEGDRLRGKFVYKDGFPRSTWASMALSVVQLQARQLAMNGCLFMSIDDVEQPDATQILQQVFGWSGAKSNFIGTLPCVLNLKGNNDEYAFAGTHEYLLFAVRDRGTMVPGLLPLDEEEAEEWMTDEYGPYKQGANLKSTGANAPRQKRPNLWFPVFIAADETAYVSPNDEPRGPRDLRVWPTTNGLEMSWRWSKGKFGAQPDDVIVVRDGGSVSLYKKQRPELGDVPSGKPKSTLYNPRYSSGNGTQQQKALFGRKVFENPKPLDFIVDILRIGLGKEQGLVLDMFAGSGTTAHAVIRLNREDGGRRRFTLAEIGSYFNSVLVPRIKKVTFTPDWKDGKPARMATKEEIERGPRIIKVLRLESYEDALNNLETQRTPDQQQVLFSPDADGADGFREDYLLRYMLDVETRESPSLLNVRAFLDPTAYKLKVKHPGSDESREVAVDLLETFNWLLGLVVREINAPQTFSAEFQRSKLGRLELKVALKVDSHGPWWFRTVTGMLRSGERVLVLWRKRPGGEKAEGIEQDNLVLDEWLRKVAYSTRDLEFDLIYVNGDNNLPNVKRGEENWKVRLIDEEFHRLMFEGTDA